MADPDDRRGHTRSREEAVREQALIDAAVGGDRSAIEALLREHLPSIHAVCARMCADRGDADDAAQEALLSIARGLSRFDGRSALSTWIYRITTNACLDELRRRRRRPEPVDPTEVPPARAPVDTQHSPEGAAIGAESRRELLAALSELPEEFRVVVVLRDVADLDYSSIAEIADVPIGTVRSRIARGRGRLADLLHSRAGTESSRETSNPPGTS